MTALPRRVTATSLATILGLGMAACTSSSDDGSGSTSTRSVTASSSPQAKASSADVKVVADRLSIPWSVVFPRPDDDRILRVEPS